MAALFGLAVHPTIAQGRVPLLLRLTSPAGRPIQTTRDLPGFWRGSWAMVAREMRGRYPRHPWPDDPAAADPTLRTTADIAEPYVAPIREQLTAAETARKELSDRLDGYKQMPDGLVRVIGRPRR